MSSYVEEYEVGKPFPLSPGRTISEADINLFAGLVGDFTPIHVDANYAGKTQFGGRIAHGTLTMSTAIGLLTQLNLLGEGVIALLNLNFDFKGVVMIGDTIYARSKVLGKRESASRPYAGIVEVQTEGFNQDGAIVLTFRRKLMVYRQGHAPGAQLPVPVNSAL